MWLISTRRVHIPIALFFALAFLFILAKVKQCVAINCLFVPLKDSFILLSAPLFANFECINLKKSLSGYCETINLFIFFSLEIFFLNLK
jgi:hypothetical protein